jgi:peptide/nickel transport system substrate-binding protein
MKKILFIIIAVVMATSMLLASCGPSETQTPTATQPTATQPTATQPTATQPTATQPTATQPTATSGLGDLAKPPGGINGGRLQQALGSAVLNLSEITQGAGPVDAFYAFPCVEPLIRLDGNQNFQPWLAERFVIADDFSSITLYLRHGVKFHDGTDFNADAVVYAVESALVNPQYTIGKKFKEPVVIDPYTVRLDFIDGVWDWDSAKGLGYWWGLLMYSPTAAATHDKDWLKTHVVGTGPFIFTEYALNQRVSYDKNPNYWRGVPYLDGMDINIIPDPTTQLLAYKAGELDILAPQLKDVQRLQDEGFSITESNDIVTNFVLVPSSNNPDSPLSNVLVRQAVAYAIDQEALIEGLTFGLGKTSQQLFPFEPYMDPDVVGYPYNPTEAMRLLDLAGYGDGLTLTMTYSEMGNQDVPPALQEMFADVGITLVLNKVSYLQSAAMIFGTGWDGFLYSFTMPGKTVDPGFTAGMYITQGGWVSLAKPADIAAEINAAATEADAAARTAMYVKISKDLTDVCEWQFLYWQSAYTSITPFLKGSTTGQYKEFFAYTYAYYTE